MVASTAAATTATKATWTTTVLALTLILMLQIVGTVRGQFADGDVGVGVSSCRVSAKSVKLSDGYRY